MTAITVKEAIQAPSPAYGFIFQESPKKAQALLSLQITELVGAFNVGKTMDKYQVANCVKRILEDNDFRCFKPDDFRVCFTKLIKGHYGKVYDCMDEPTIFLALNQYLQERINEVEAISDHRHELEKSGKMSAANPEGQKKVVEIIKKALGEAPFTATVEEERKETPIVKPIKKTERDQYIQDCFTEFFKLSDRKGGFVEYNGKHLNETEYVQIKLTEYDINQKNKNL